MRTLEELLAALANGESLTAEELAHMEAELLAAFDEERDSDTPSIERLTEIRDQVRSTREAAAALEEAEAERARQIAELEAEVRPAAEGEEPDGEGETPAEEETEEPAGEETPTEEPPAAGETPAEEAAGEPSETETPAAVAAAAAAPPARATLGEAARRVPAQHRARPRVERQHNRIVRRGAEGEFASFDDVAAAMTEAVNASLGTHSSATVKQPIARVLADYPAERQLSSRFDPALNMERVNAAGAGSPEALVAAGGRCAPLTPYYGLAQIADASRPVRAALASFQADRGGISFATPLSVGALAGAVDQWTMADDVSAADGDPTKTCLRIDCDDFTDAEIYAVTRCLTFGNVQARTWPESVGNRTQLTMAAHARLADSLLLDQIKAASKQQTTTPILGAARDFLRAVGAAAAGFRSVHRMDAEATLVVAIPAWMRDAMRDDLALQLPGDDTLAAANAEIAGYLTARNVRPFWYIDTPSTGTSQVFPHGANEQPLADYPEAVQWGIWHDGAHLFLDAGTLDLGTVRDSTLNSTNDYQLFAETFEGHAFVGVDSRWITTGVCVNGGTAGTVDTSDVCGGPYVPGS